MNEALTKRKALLIKNTIENDRFAFYPGRRNNDSVDYCIACHVLGLDPIKELEMAFEFRKGEGYPFAVDKHSALDDFVERREKIQYYLDNSWGDDDDPSAVFDYLIGTYE